MKLKTIYPCLLVALTSATFVGVANSHDNLLTEQDTTSKSDSLELTTVDPRFDFIYQQVAWKDSNKTSADEKDKTSKDGKERKDWSHGGKVSFDSGYVKNYFGAVASVAIASPVSTTFDSTMSPVHLPADSKGKVQTTTKVQEAYLKGHFTFKNAYVKGIYGVKQRHTETYEDSTSKLLHANSYGYDIYVDYGEFAHAYYTEIRGGANRNDSTFNQALNKFANDSSVEYIRIGGIKLNYKGLTLTGELGNSQNTLERLFVQAAYEHTLNDKISLAFDARYGQNQHKSTDDKDKKYDSKYYNLNATVVYGPASVGFGFNNVLDNNYESSYIPSANMDNSHFNSSLSLSEDFAAASEKAYLVKLGYDFAVHDLDGLKLALWFAQGKDAQYRDDNDKLVAIKDFNRKELGAELAYAFNGDLDGLTIKYRYVNYRAKGQKSDSETVITGINLNNQDNHRLTLSYNFNAF